MAKAASPNGTPVNKSEAIRGFLPATPGGGTKDVVAGLGEKGVKVAPTLVYFIRSKANQAKRRAKRDRVAEPSRQTAPAYPVALIQTVRDLGRQVGGIRTLKKLVDLLAE